MFVVTEDNVGNPATAAYCESVRAEYDLGPDVLVLMDPEHRFAALYGANDATLVFEQGGEITHRRRYTPYYDVIAAIEAALAD